MFKIHEIYLILIFPRLMYSVNHNEKKFNRERKIVTSDLKVLMKSEI